jgi:hypothetical protein
MRAESMILAGVPVKVECQSLFARECWSLLLISAHPSI